MLIDTHAHVNLAAFASDANAVLQRCFESGVVVVNVGTEYSTSEAAVNMLSDYPENVYAVVGLHPSHTYDNPYLDEQEGGHIKGREVFDYEKYKALVDNEKVVGIGECGLDYYRLQDADIRMDTDDADNTDTKIILIKQQQKEAFLQQIKLAQELDKALVIHCRPSEGSTDAYIDALEILRSYQLSAVSYKLMFEIHSFTGSLEVAQKFLELGGFLGFNGIITFDKTGNMAEVVKNIPLERILLETDAPYLTPPPHRGKRNEPANVRLVAEKIAEIKGVSFEEVALQTTKNAKELFKINFIV